MSSRVFLSGPLSANHAAAMDAKQKLQEIAAKEFMEEKREPVERFDAALKSGDIDALNQLLSDAWFGVPESTSCWSITGFSECVDLMDDPPED